MFNIGDIVYFLLNGVVSYGQIVEINESILTISPLSQNGITTFLSDITINENMVYLNALDLITPSPTPTPYTTLTPTPSVNPSPTPSVSVSMSSQAYPNLLSLNNIKNWVIQNGNIDIISSEKRMIFTITGKDSIFGVEIPNIIPNKYYKLSFDYEQIDIEYVIISLKKLASTNGFGLSIDNPIDGDTPRIEINIQDSMEYGYFGGSGHFEAKVFSEYGENFYFSLDMFLDPNFTTRVSESGYQYSIANPLLQYTGEDVPRNDIVSLTPTPSVSPTLSVSPTITPTITPTSTLLISPTPSVSISPSVQHVNLVNLGMLMMNQPTPTISVTPTITPSYTPSVTPSVTPSAS